MHDDFFSLLFIHRALNLVRKFHGYVFKHSFFIQLEDSNYKPLDPDTIRLPPPAPPTDRLLDAVKAFYMPPGHFAPRDR